MEYREFTWFEKLTRVLATIPEEFQGQWTIAVVNYGTRCIEPTFDEWGLVAAFEGVRDDIDRSANARSNRGGRPKTGGSDSNENLSEQGGAVGFETSDNPPSEKVTGGFETSDNPPSEKVTGGFETSDNPSLYIGIGKGRDKGKGRDRGRGGGTGEEKRKRFKPPTLNEVQDFITANNLNVDAGRFVDYYTSNGWKVGRGNPMKDWRSAARNWSRNEKKGGEADVSPELKQAAEYL